MGPFLYQLIYCSRSLLQKTHRSQNAVIMAFGVIAILGSAAYLAYMKSQHREKKVYVAIAEDGMEQLMTKKSKWD
ncbi:uncharacterized protein LOC143022422 isoform X2 [Oratosquilla oratoria]|uniref:uncharacterized protein LOC143022422 isoform X2 n=1 Tax=Oratosquilla oratoria TaxID=337810 RepID=UPI003F773682